MSKQADIVTAGAARTATDPTAANQIDVCLSALARLGTDLTTKDDVLSALTFCKRLREIASDLSAQAEKGAMGFIEANGDIVDGEKRYYVAPNKTTKCVDLRGTMAALLTAAGGDEEVVYGCMSASAWKHGAVKKNLPPEVYEKLFETKETKGLEEGKPTKRLQTFDPEFQR